MPTSLVIPNKPENTSVKKKVSLTPPPTEKIPEVIFKVQLAASPNKIETSNKKWSKIPYIEVRKEKSLYKYLTGNHFNYEQALETRNSLLSQGFNGAFVVAYKKGERISLKVAKELFFNCFVLLL